MARKREEAASLCLPFYIPITHMYAAAASRVLPILGPVISDNVNDLVESPPQRMICDM